LTGKENDLLSPVARNQSKVEVSALAFANESTAKTRVGGILRELGLPHRVQIVVFACEHGLVRATPAVFSAASLFRTR
jgi:DNA-binding CsgD family transcriptional regulator